MSDPQKTAIVTGASGDLGVVICRHLVGAGFRVLAQYHERPERLERLRDGLGESARLLETVRADLTREEGARALFAPLTRGTAGLDVLVNNAGGVRAASLDALSLQSWNDCLALNLTAAFLCTREAVPFLRPRQGLVLNISSVAALTGGAFGAHYAAAKAGLIGLTRSAARELGRYGIRVNAIAPGPVESAMTSSLPSDALQGLLATTALGRVVAPAEIASAVLAFATGLPAVTGQTLVIDGGRVFH